MTIQQCRMQAFIHPHIFMKAHTMMLNYDEDDERIPSLLLFELTKIILHMKIKHQLMLLSLNIRTEFIHGFFFVCEECHDKRDDDDDVEGMKK